MARLLLVEDDDFLRFLFKDALTDAGHNVVEAESADVAGSLLRAQPSFDALLTNLNLPGSINWLALGQLFRQSHPDRPIVYVNGAPESLPFSWPRSDKDVVLEKPCSLSKLVSFVDAFTQ